MIPASSMKGDAAMTEIIVMWIFTLVGLIVVKVFKILEFDDHRHTDDNRQESASPEHPGGNEPHERSSQQPKVAA
jgi:hypothetical protein